jgi:hypothetical protein
VEEYKVIYPLYKFINRFEFVNAAEGVCKAAKDARCRGHTEAIDVI